MEKHTPIIKQAKGETKMETKEQEATQTEANSTSPQEHAKEGTKIVEAEVMKETQLQETETKPFKKGIIYVIAAIVVAISIFLLTRKG